MIKESEYKKKLIKKLNCVHSSWEDGDRDMSMANIKTADIVNHRLKIAIEVKDDKKNKMMQTPLSGEVVTNETDLVEMNKQVRDKVKSAHKKFEQYPGYKTVLILRSEITIPYLIKIALEGLDTFSRNKNTKELVYKGKTGKYSQYVGNNIGCFLIMADDYYYLSNKKAKKDRVSILKKEINEIFNLKFKDLNLN